jgi:hypothetical protein
MARPKIEIDYILCENLAKIQCTQEEIAQIVGVSVRTLQRDDEFCRVYKKGMDQGRMSLRRQQFKSAESGNVTMQIWLGKQYLNQRDRSEIDTNITTSKLDDLVEQFNDIDKED